MYKIVGTMVICYTYLYKYKKGKNCNISLTIYISPMTSTINFSFETIFTELYKLIINNSI